MDDRRGTSPKMTPEVYNTVIEQAHKSGMLLHAHAIQMADQKAVVRAGADVLVHTVQNEPIDDELMALLREKKPYWTTVIGLGDRSEACDGDPFLDQTYPQETLHEIHEKDCAPRPASTPVMPSVGPTITSSRAGCSRGCRLVRRSWPRRHGRPSCSAPPTSGQWRWARVPTSWC